MAAEDNSARPANSQPESKLVALSIALQARFRSVFFKWGNYVGSAPFTVMIVSVILGVAFTSGMFVAAKEDDDPQTSWVPRGSQGVEDRDRAEDIFGSSTRPIFIWAEAEGDNLVTKEVYSLLYDFDLQVRTELSTKVDGKTYEWPDLCSKSEGSDSCSLNGHPLAFWADESVYPNPSYKAVTEEVDTDSLLDRINSGKSINNASRIISIENMFGESDPKSITANEDEPGPVYDLKSAKAMRWIYFLSRDRDLEKDEVYTKWEEEFGALVKKFNDSQDKVTLHVQTLHAFLEAFRESITGDLVLLQIGIFLIIFYSMFVISKFQTIRSKVFLALMGVVGVGLAYSSSYGLASYFGQESSGVHNLLLFLLLGIGVDDMYVIVHAFEQTNAEAPIKERIAKTMEIAGVSITITSFTDCLAFALGATSSLSALASFCAFACLGILFDYFFQITFFTAWLVYDGKRQQKGKGDCWGACACAPAGAFCCYGRFYNESEAALQRFMREKYAPFLAMKPVKIAVIAIFTAFTAVCIWGITNVKPDFSNEWFVDSENELQDVWDVRDEYFPDSGVTVNFYTEPIDYTTEENQRLLRNLILNAENCQGCSKEWVIDGTVDAWYTSFNTWVERGSCTSVSLTSDGFIPSDDFYSCFNTWYDSGESGPYKSQIRLTDDKATIQSTKISADVVAIDGTAEGADMMDDLRDIAETGPEDTFVYASSFLDYEQYKVFIKETILNVSLALVAVAIVTIVLISNVKAALIVLFMIILVDIDLLALIYFWDLTLNAVTVANIVMALGLAIDYSSHIAQAFMAAAHGNKNDRMIAALDEIGPSVFHGAFSTLLPVLVLAGSKNYIFVVFHRMWFGIIVFGASHGLILLPVLLSLIGPPSSQRPKEIDDEESRKQSVEMAKKSQPDDL